MNEGPTHMCLGTGDSTEISVPETCIVQEAAKGLLPKHRVSSHLVLGTTMVVTAELPGHQQVASRSSHRAGNLGQ